MTDRVKVYEEKKSGLPVWAWLLPLLLLIALLAWFFTRHHDEPAAVSTATPAAATPAYPDLGAVRFNTDQATLTPEDEQILQRAAASMKQNPNARLRLEGFTDSTGTAPHNDTLSERRTTAVADYLQSQGIDRNRLTGQGFGAAKPVDTNATEQGKADNRRVELFSQQ